MSEQRKQAHCGMLMTVGEVATELGVKPRTVYRWLDADRIPEPIHFGGTTRFRRADIEFFVEVGSMSAFQRAKRLQRKA